MNNLILSTNSITSSGGNISFDNENLSTMSTVATGSVNTIVPKYQQYRAA